MSLAVVKMRYNHIDSLWVPVADASPVVARELQRIARIAKKPKLQRTQQKREESDFSINFRKQSREK